MLRIGTGGSTGYFLLINMHPIRLAQGCLADFDNNIDGLMLQEMMSQFSSPYR
jgi:hypothetical protein